MMNNAVYIRYPASDRLYARCALTLCLLLQFAPGLCRAGTPVSFRNDVAPILLDNCVACHGPKKAEGGYRIDTFDELLKPGDSGESIIQHTADAGGELLRRLVTADESERMPYESDPLTGAQIDVIKRWIAEKATFDGANRADPLSLVIPPRHYADPPASYALPIPIAALAFSPDGSQILAGGYHEVTVWNVPDHTLARRIKNIGQRVFAIAFLPDSKTIAIGCGEPGRNGEVRLVDFESGNVKSVIARTSDVVLDLAVRPKSDELAVASADSLIRIINLATLAEVRTIASHADWVTGVAWSADGTRLVSASRDKSAKVFDATNGELLVSYQGHGSAVRGVAFLPDGKEVISTGSDNKLHRWSVEGAKKVAEVGLDGEAYEIACGDGFVVVPSTNKQVRRIDLAKNSISHSLSGHQDWILSTALNAGTNRIASGSMDGEIRLWNLSDGSLIKAWTAKP